MSDGGFATLGRRSLSVAASRAFFESDVKVTST